MIVRFVRAHEYINFLLHFNFSIYTAAAMFCADAIMSFMRLVILEIWKATLLKVVYVSMRLTKRFLLEC